MNQDEMTLQIVEDKNFGLICRFITDILQLKETHIVRPHRNVVHSFIYVEPNDEIVMKYDPEMKALIYTNSFVSHIYEYIPDCRLLECDNKLIGKVFEKLFNKTVYDVYGFTEIWYM